MKIFLDTADAKAIERWVKTGLINGVTTNPSHLSVQGGDAKEHIKRIAALLEDGDVSVEITESDPKNVYEQAQKIAALGSNITVKIPCDVRYYEIISRLAKEGIRLNITLVFSMIQGMMMAKLGVRYISPFVGRWDDIDVDGIAVIAELREGLDRYGYQTQLLAASLRHVRHVHDAILAGADVITVPLEVMEKMTQHVLTTQGIEKFNADWQKLGIRQFP